MHVKVLQLAREKSPITKCSEIRGIRDFLGSRGMGEAQGKKVEAPPLRQALHTSSSGERGFHQYGDLSF
jgi:hypothetical protein